MRLGWRIARLGEICTFNYGKSLPESVRKGGSTPVFGSNGVVGYHDVAITSGRTIVIGRKGSFGEVNYSEVPSWPIDTAYFVDETSTEQDIRWLFHRLSSLGLNQMNKAAAVPGLNREDACRREVLLPPLSEQRRIAAILDKADALRAKRREALAQLDRLAQSIFVEMFGDPATNPMGWPKKRLDSFCEVGSSKRVFVEELVDKGVPFFRGTEIGQMGGNLTVSPTLFISPDHYRRLKAEAGVPCKGDLLLPSICPDGRIYLVDTDLSFYFKDARVLWIKVNQTEVNSVFLRQFLKQLFARDYSKIASGTIFAELKIFALKELQIMLPSQGLQFQFGALIEASQLQRGKLQSSLEALEHLFQVLQHRAFQGGL